MTEKGDMPIFVGPAGWNYKDWYSIVYPGNPDKKFKELDYIARFFDTAEINSSFYRPPNAPMAHAWVRKVSHNPRFTFTAKVWQRFTHERKAFTAEEAALFIQGIDPLAQAGKLGALLCQFPWSFKKDDFGIEWLQLLLSTFKAYPVVMELRHSSWDNEDTYSFLDRNNAGFASIDQPVIGKSIPFKPVRTGPVGYVRMHGRNYKAWFAPKKDNEETHPSSSGSSGSSGSSLPSNRSPDAPQNAPGSSASPPDLPHALPSGSPSARYDYLYSRKEIGEIAEKVLQVAQGAKKTFVIQNNHPFGQAVANALQLRAALGEEDILVPATMLRRFPDLSSIGRPTA